MSALVTIQSHWILQAEENTPKKSALEKYGKGNPIPPPTNYELGTEWKELLKVSADPTSKDRQVAMNILWGAKIGPGQETANYVLKLIKIFKDDPVWFIKTGLNYFDNNQSCLYYWFIPKTQYIEYKEFLELSNSAKTKAPGDKKIISFIDNSKSYLDKVRAKKGIPSLAKCKLHVHKMMNSI